MNKEQRITCYKEFRYTGSQNCEPCNVAFPLRSDAEYVLSELYSEVDLFDRACLHTFYKNCLIMPKEEDRAIGWSKLDINAANVRKDEHGWYYISLPKPYEIKRIKPYQVIEIWRSDNVN